LGGRPKVDNENTKKNQNGTRLQKPRGITTRGIGKKQVGKDEASDIGGKGRKAEIARHRSLRAYPTNVLQLLWKKVKKTSHEMSQNSSSRFAAMNVSRSQGAEGEDKKEKGNDFPTRNTTTLHDKLGNYLPSKPR